MKNYMMSFVKSPYLYISLLLICIFPVLNIIHNIQLALQMPFKINTFDFYIGPYTMWVGIDNGGGHTSFMYMLLPIVVAIPCVFIYFDNKQSGYHYFARYKLQNNKYKNLFFLSALVIGFLLTFVTLLTNFLSMFLIWPNFHIDYTALDNAGRGVSTFMFPALFFENPFLFTIINIILVSMYGSMFAVISITCCVYISKKFICITIPFTLQILIGFLSTVYKSKNSWTPAQFLDMSITASRLPSFWIFIIPIAVIMAAYIIYKIKDVNYE